MMSFSRTLLMSAIIILISTFSAKATEVNNQVAKMAKELEQKSKTHSKQRIAILQFRTDKNKLTPFNKFIQDEIAITYSNSAMFEVIDINATNRIVEKLNWDLTQSNNFNIYDKISEAIFKDLGILPNAFIYGQINDNNETITLTGYLVPNGLKSTNIQSMVRLNSTEQTDKLLGKPIVQRPKPQAEVIYKEKIMEKEVIKEVPVYVEKEVTKEVPVYIEKEIIKEVPARDEAKKEDDEHIKTLGNLKIEVLSAVFNGNSIIVTFKLTNSSEDQSLPNCWVRFFDQDGNEFKYTSTTIQFANLIAGVTAKKTCTFNREKLSNVKLMNVLEVELSGLGKVQFKNIKVTN